MHEPTPHARRVAALRYQAERLLQDAAAWGCEVRIFGPSPSDRVVILRAVPLEPAEPYDPEKEPRFHPGHD